MRDELLGYLLGALDAAEHDEVERQLAEQPALQSQLQLLARSLDPLAVDREPHEPPPGLAACTCAFVLERTTLADDARPTPADDARPTPAGERLAQAIEPPARSKRWTLADVVVAAGVCAAATLLFFPAILHSRQQAQLAACQHNMRVVGEGLHSYAQLHGGLFPVTPVSGNLAVAGSYAPQLLEDGHVTDMNAFFCGSRCALTGAPRRIPLKSELEAASGAQLAELQRQVGGDYGYTLGYQHEGQWQPVRNLGRSTYAVLADAPCPDSDARRSKNHGGRGQNVWFEDGHIRFVKDCRLTDCGDDFYRNEQGRIEAGLHVDDAVVGASWTRPLPITLIGR